MNALVISLTKICLLAVVLVGTAICKELKPVSHMSIYEGNVSSQVPNGGGPRSVVFTCDLPCPSGGPVLVNARTHSLRYIDLKRMNIFRENYFSGNEIPVVSSNGRYVAVTSDKMDRKTNSVLRRVSVEDFKGEKLWEIGAAIVSPYEPTPDGGLVVYPRCVSSIEGATLLPPRILPEPLHEGLLVYDRFGRIKLVPRDVEDVRCGYWGSVSADGSSLALAYVWDPKEVEDETQASDVGKIRVVLYDIEKGEKVGGCFLNETAVHSLALNAGGDRLLCLAEMPPVRQFRIYLFDRDGNELATAHAADYETFLPVARPVLSANGQYCAFTVRDARTYLMRMVDGDKIWEFGSPLDRSGERLESHDTSTRSDLKVLSVGDDGGALLAGVRKDSETGTYEEALWVVDGCGVVLDEFGVEAQRPGDRVTAGWMSRDGASVWLIQGRRLTHYAIVP